MSPPWRLLELSLLQLPSALVEPPFRASLALPLDTLVDRDGDHDHRSGDECAPGRVDPEEDDPARDRGDDQSAEERPDDRPAPTLERGAADDHGSHDGQQELTPRIGVDRAELTDREHPGETADRTHEDEDEDSRSRERNPRKPRGLRIAADWWR